MTAANRKTQTETLLKSLNIPVYPELPLIEEEAEAKVRTAQDIAKRILVLIYLNVASEDEAAKVEIVSFLKSQKLWQHASPEEKLLFEKPRLNEKESISISWQTEAIKLLLWCIYKIDTVDLPTKEAEISTILEVIPEFMDDPTEFIEEASVRDIPELLDMSDFLFRLHSAVAEEEDDAKLGEINPGIVFERHIAINWVTCMAENWDEVVAET